MSHEISNVFVPVIVTNKRIPELVLEDINKNMSFMFKNNNFIFVGNSNISNVHLCVCVCVCLRPSTLMASSVWGW